MAFKLQDYLGLDQRDYINSIIQQYSLDLKPTRSTPLPVALDPYNNLSGDGSIPTLQEIVGKLRYLADRTRPDIAFATSYLARFAANPAPEHWKLALRTVQYLKGTKLYSGQAIDHWLPFWCYPIIYYRRCLLRSRG